MLKGDIDSILETTNLMLPNDRSGTHPNLIGTFYLQILSLFGLSLLPDVHRKLIMIISGETVPAFYCHFSLNTFGMPLVEPQEANLGMFFPFPFSTNR